MHTHAQSGYLLVLVLVFGAIFFTVLSAFMGFVVTQQKAQHEKLQGERALAMAEAGLNYYKWYLAHNPNDVTNGTGQPGPYDITYDDPESGTIGEISIDVSSNTACGDIMSIDITATAHTSDAPDVERTVYARYARPTVAEYAYIINSNVWAGADRTIIGPYHTNGIVRMDGTNNSIVSSGQEEWTCDGSLPCDPDDPGDTVDAVYGDGPGSDLWLFPRPPISFAGITVDLANMQTRAESDGIYIGPSGEYGYRVDFQNDDTIDVYIVDETYNYEGYTSESGWQTERHVIEDDDFFATYTVPGDCSLVFIEDKVWLEGEVSSRTTLVAADVDTTGVDPSIILNGDITSTNEDAGLLAIGEQNVLVGLVVPDDMTLDGIFVAQNGRFGRNHYNTSHLPEECVAWVWIWCVDYDVYFSEYITRDTLTINGTIVSNGRVGTKWTSGGTFVSGFETRYNSYDRDLVTDPPPLTPDTSDTYQFIEWREGE